jgi:hypothetical protein
LLGRAERFFGERLEAQIAAEGLFDAAIFERVETDDRQPAAGLQAVGDALEREIERFQFAIDGDPQCLKGARGGVDPIAGSRHAAANQFGQLTGRANRLLQAALHDPPGDAPAEAFFAKLVD